MDVGLEKGVLIGWQRILPTKFPLQPHRPNPGTGEGTGIAAIGKHQLSGATTDIQDQVGLIAKGHPRKHAQIDQTGLLRTTHQIHLEAQLVLQCH